MGDLLAGWLRSGCVVVKYLVNLLIFIPTFTFSYISSLHPHLNLIPALPLLTHHAYTPPHSPSILQPQTPPSPAPPLPIHPCTHHSPPCPHHNPPTSAIVMVQHSDACTDYL